MPRTNAIALALVVSLAFHVLLVLTVPSLRLKYRASTERLIQVEVAEPQAEPPPPPEPPPEPLRPAEPEAPPPLPAEQAEALSRVLARVGTPAPPPSAPPVRLPRRAARLPEPDRLPWTVPLAPGPLVERRPRPDVPEAPKPPDREALAGLAEKLLAGVASPPPTADTPDSPPRLDIEWETGAERRVVGEPPRPQVPIRHTMTVRIQFTVSPRGNVVQTEVLETADPELDQAALAYVKGLRFNALPADQEQKPQWGTIRVRFRLE